MMTPKCKVQGSTSALQSKKNSFYANDEIEDIVQGVVDLLQLQQAAKKEQQEESNEDDNIDKWTSNNKYYKDNKIHVWKF